MYEKQNKHYTFNDFPKRNVLNARENVEEIHFVPVRACLFYYGCITNIRNRILNIDHLEMKQA